MKVGTFRNGIGNLLAKLGGRGPRLLVGAHADEISFRVKSITDDGYLWLTAGRGQGELRSPEPVPLGHRALVVTERGIVEGTYCLLGGHVLTPRQRADRDSQCLGWRDFFVDLGMSSRAEVEEAGIHPGCPVVTHVETRRVGRNIVGKALDDRVGLAILTCLLERIEPSRLAYEVWLGSTVMEECGTLGARSMAEGFDLAVVIEVGLAGDVPGCDPAEMPVVLGGGPTLVHKDVFTHYDAGVTRKLEGAARSAGVTIQHGVFNNYNSDGQEWTRQGVPTGLLTFPCRYTHNPFETVRASDIEAMVDLLEAFVYGRYEWQGDRS